MNKRIKLLADEAAKFSAIMALPTGESGDKLFVEKFAELIVQECADQFKLVHTDEQYQRRIDKTILKHFGLYK